jgi:iron complex outermembrane recepter protein
MDDSIDYCRTDAAGNCLLTPSGDPMSRDVKSYTLVDWQTKYSYTKALSFTLGIKNLFDSKPPFSIVDQSGTSNARGYDARYTDPIGRQFYLVGNYKF